MINVSSQFWSCVCVSMCTDAENAQIPWSPLTQTAKRKKKGIFFHFHIFLPHLFRYAVYLTALWVSSFFPFVVVRLEAYLPSNPVLCCLLQSCCLITGEGEYVLSLWNIKKKKASKLLSYAGSCMCLPGLPVPGCEWILWWHEEQVWDNFAGK